MSKNTKFTLFLFSSFIIVLILNFFVRDATTYAFLRLVPFIVSIGLGIISGLYAARAYGFESEHGQAILILVAGMICTLVGDLIFDFVYIFDQTIPYPSIADFLYILGYLFFFIGFVKEVLIYRVNFQTMNPLTKILFFIFMLLIGAIIIYFEVYLQYDPTGSFIANLARMSLGVIDFFLMLLVVLILRMSLSFGKGKFFIPWLAIFFAVVSSMAGNLVFSMSAEKYLASEWPYTMLNVFWVVSYLLVSFAFVGIGRLIHGAENSFSKE